MKKKTLTLTIIFLISIFMFNSKVEASDIVAWIDCSYDVYEDDEDDIEHSGIIALVGTGKLYQFIPKSTMNGECEAKNYNDFIKKCIHDLDGCWYKDGDDIGKNCNTNKDKRFDSDEVINNLLKGTCPKIVRYSDDTKKKIVFAGTTTPNSTEKLYNQYRFIKYNQTEGILGEGYSKNGSYIAAINGEQADIKVNDIDLSWGLGSILANLGEIMDGIGWASQKRILSTNYIINYGKDFTKVAEHKSYFDGQVIFDSSSNIEPLNNKVDNWYDKYFKNSDMEKLLSNNKNLIISCKNLNSAIDDDKDYTFNQGYTASEMLNGLAGFLPSFKKKYSSLSSNGYPMCLDENTTTDPYKSAYNCSVKELLGDTKYVPKGLDEFVYKDIQNHLESKGLSNVDYKTTVSDLTYCAVNLNKNADKYGLNSEETSKVKNNYEDYSKNLGIAIVYDCESLIGDNIAKKIEKYFNIVKIAVPIILIAFGIVDFAQAVFAGDEEKMKKAQKKFISRIIASVLIFLTPVLVKLLLGLANEVWSNISADGCGIF